MFKYLWIGLLLILMTPGVAASTPQVVATIKPIHALVSGVMAGIETPYLLLPGGESPHSYSLHPSQVRRLHGATLVIWIGPTVESFLEKTLTTLSKQTEILRLIDLADLTRLEVRKGKNWETHYYHADAHHTDFEVDPHIWLSPENAKIIVQTIAQTLIKMDAKNAERYTANANHLVEQLDQLDQDLKQQLAAVKGIPFLVFHDAYQYFEQHYGLKAIAAVSLSSEIRPSVKRLYQLKRFLKKQKNRCVFSEPQFGSALIDTLIENSSARRAELDPLGAQLPAGTESYFILLRNMADSVKECLQTVNQSN